MNSKKEEWFFSNNHKQGVYMDKKIKEYVKPSSLKNDIKSAVIQSVVESIPSAINIITKELLKMKK